MGQRLQPRGCSGAAGSGCGLWRGLLGIQKIFLTAVGARWGGGWEVMKASGSSSSSRGYPELDGTAIWEEKHGLSR